MIINFRKIIAILLIVIQIIISHGMICFADAYVNASEQGQEVEKNDEILDEEVSIDNLDNDEREQNKAELDEEIQSEKTTDESLVEEDEEVIINEVEETENVEMSFANIEENEKIDGENADENNELLGLTWYDIVTLHAGSYCLNGKLSRGYVFSNGETTKVLYVLHGTLLKDAPGFEMPQLDPKYSPSDGEVSNESIEFYAWSAKQNKVNRLNDYGLFDNSAKSKFINPDTYVVEDTQSIYAVYDYILDPVTITFEGNDKYPFINGKEKVELSVRPHQMYNLKEIAGYEETEINSDYYIYSWTVTSGSFGVEPGSSSSPPTKIKTDDLIAGKKVLITSPVTLTPRIEPKSYSVSFFNPFKTFAADNNKLFTYEVKTFIPIHSKVSDVSYARWNHPWDTDPATQGYHFDGWYKIPDNIDHTDLYFLSNLLDTGDESINAEPGIDVHFKYIQPKRLGLVDISSNSNKKVDADTEVLERMILIPAFTSTVTFDAGDGKFSNGETTYNLDKVKPRITTFGSLKYEVPVSNKSGCIFENWRIESVDGPVVTDEYILDKDIKLVAQYSKSVKVTFDPLEGEIISENSTLEVPIGYTFAQMILPKVKRDNYDFVGWYFDNGTFENEVVLDGENISIVNDDVRVYAKWKIKSFPVVFYYKKLEKIMDKYGAEIKYYKETVATTINVDYGSKIKDAKDFSKVAGYFDFTNDNNNIIEGYKILALKEYDEKGNDITSDAVVTEDTYIYVVTNLVSEYTIKFDAADGKLNGESELKVFHGIKFGNIEVPTATKQYYKFKNWKTSTGEVVTSDYEITKSETFTAEYTLQTVMIVLKSGRGSFSNGEKTQIFKSVPKGTLIKNIESYEDPIYDYKEFVSWQSENDGNYYSRDAVVTSECTYVAGYADTYAKISIDTNNCIFQSKYYDSIGAYPYGHKIRVESGIAEISAMRGRALSDVFDEYDVICKLGFKHIGYKDEKGVSVDTAATIVDKDMKIVISTDIRKFCVSIDANGGTYEGTNDEITVMTFDNLDLYTLVENIEGYRTPKREGWTLIGYSTNKDDETGDLQLKITSDRRVYAIWEEVKTQNPVANTKPSNTGNGNNYGGSGGSVSQTNQQKNQTQNNQPSNAQVEGPMSAINALNNALNNNINAQAVNSNNIEQANTNTAQNTSQNTVQIEVSQVAQVAANTQVNAVLKAVGMTDTAVATSETVKQVANEVAAGLDMKQTVEAMLTQVQTKAPEATVKANVSEKTISANNAKWTADANGNISLVRADTNEKVANTWQKVGQSNGKNEWYKFDDKGNMQTGLITDNGKIYYLKETRDSSFGQMAVNETVNVGGLIMTFSEDGVLKDMQYSIEKANQKIVNAAMAQTVALNAAVSNINSVQMTESSITQQNQTSITGGLNTPKNQTTAPIIPIL